MDSLVKKSYIENWLMIAVIIVFCILTVPLLLNHTPWFDEVHAWTLAKDINIHNVRIILHNEGHFIIWYLILMPFAKLNLWYPYSLKFLNWGIYFIAIIFMWRKAPFNPVFKTIITLSWISVNYFAIVSRCYSIGILGLFILAHFYNKKLERPILYSTLLILTAHTSLLATLAVIPLALIFLFDIIKNWNYEYKNKYIYSIFILMLGAILWIFPFLDGYGTKELLLEHIPTYDTIIEMFKISKCVLGISYIVCNLFILIKADNRIRFFLIATNIGFFLFFWLIYTAYPTHIIFLAIYLIIAFWLTEKLHKRDWSVYLFMLAFALLSLLNIRPYFMYILNNSNNTHIVNYINYQNPKYIIIPWRFYDIQPLINEKIKILTIEDYQYAEAKKKSKNLESYLLNQFIRNNNNWDAIVLSYRKINNKSIKMVWEYYNVPNTLYITKIKKIKN